MNYPIFKQGNYTAELGTGGVITIAQDGCVECDMTSILVWFGKPEDPLKLNQELIKVGGYADNGSGQYDIFVWGAITKIYPDITLAFNNLYATASANMNLIDAQLNKNCPVIVGVSFSHNPTATTADHYVTLHAKNSNGTYQMMDPYFGDDTVFDSRYAVNGLTVGQCILHAVSYNGIVQAPYVTGNYYKGYDLTNLDSMKVAIDILVAVQQGQYMNRADVDLICAAISIPAGSTKDAIIASINQVKTDKAQAETKAAETLVESTTKDVTIGNLNKQIPDLEGQISTLDNQVLDLTQKLKSATNQLNTVVDKGNLYTQCELDLKTARDDFANATETYNRTVAQLKNTSFLGATKSQLLAQLIKKVFNLN